MVVKLNSLSRWTNLPAGQTILFEGTDVAERRVRIEFNMEAVTTLLIGDGTDAEFLCTIGPGLETVEFGAFGTFHVFAEEGAGAVNFHSADLEPTFAEIENPVVFTKIANRRHRNPELEEMMWKMNQNMERRLQSQAAEFEAALDRRRQEENNGRPAELVQSNAPGTVAGTGGTPAEQQAPNGEKSGETAGGPPPSEPKSDGGDAKAGSA